MPTLPRRPRSRVLVVALLVGALVATPVTAAALWQSSAVPPAPVVSAGALAQPVATCTSMPAAGLNVGFARVSWAAVPGATGYTVGLRTANNSASAVLATNVTATQYDVRGNLLSGLGLVLDALLAGNRVLVTVTATNNLGGASNVWSGPASAGNPIALDSLLGGLLGGLKCT